MGSSTCSISPRQTWSACSRLLRDLLKDQAIGSDAVHRCEADGDELTARHPPAAELGLRHPVRPRGHPRPRRGARRRRRRHARRSPTCCGFGDRDSPTMPELSEQADLLVADGRRGGGARRPAEDDEGHRPAPRRDRPARDRRRRRLPPKPCARLFSVEFKATRRCTGRTSSRRWRMRSNTIEDISDIVESIVLKHA